MFDQTVFQFLLLFSIFQYSVQNTELKCQVCELVVSEITSSVKAVDPKKVIQVGSFRIQPDGSQQKSQVKYAGSETHIMEIFETVCDSLDNYAQAKNKETGKLSIMNLSKDIEKLSTHDLVPDVDLNRSLKYYCESFIEDYEDDIITLFKSSEKFDEFSNKLCTQSAGYCKASRSEL